MINHEHELYKSAASGLLPDPERARIQIMNDAKEEANLRKKSSWVVPAIACACAAVVICVAVPPVRAAIQEWISARFSVQSYMGTPQEQRTELPAVEELIQTPEQSADSDVLLGDEMPGWEDISTGRAEAGFPGFESSEYAWLKDIRPETREVLYESGNLLIVTGVLSTDNPLPFYAPYVDESIADQSMALCDATLTYEDAGETVQLSGVCNLQIDNEAFHRSEEGELILNEEYVLSTGEVPFTVEFGLVRQPDGIMDASTPVETIALPEGMLGATMTLGINDANVDDMNSIGTVAQATFDISFDASEKSTPEVEVTSGQTLELAGNAVITFNYSGSYFQEIFTCSNEEVTLDGMRIEVTGIEQSLDGITLNYALTLPPSWSDEMRDAYIGDGYQNGIAFVAVVDGNEYDDYDSWMTGRDGDVSEWYVHMPIMPSGVSTLELIPVIEYRTMIDGISIPIGESVTFDLTGRDGFGLEWDHIRLDDFRFQIIG